MPPKAAKTVQPTIPELEANRVATTANVSKVAIDTSTLQAFRDIVKEVIKEEADSLREEIKRSVDPITTKLDECQEKIREHDSELSSQDARLATTEARYAELSNKYDKLLLKVDDLENRGRRCNLRILGIPEGLEQGNPTRFIAGLLYDVLGGPNGLEKPPVLDRAHRAAAASRPTDGGRSRPFIVCVHYYHEKELIQRLAREKGRLEFQGKQIYIFPDYSADLNRRRAAFNEVKGILRDRGIRYRLLYPARLQVTLNGETQVFDSPKVAKDFTVSRFGDNE